MVQGTASWGRSLQARQLPGRRGKQPTSQKACPISWFTSASLPSLQPGAPEMGLVGKQPQ